MLPDWRNGGRNVLPASRQRALSCLCDDLRTRSDASGIRRGVGAESRERREDGADDHPNETGKLGVCAGGARGGSTVSARRSRIRRNCGNLGFRPNFDREGTPYATQ